jgi:hypothetical protein
MTAKSPRALVLSHLSRGVNKMRNLVFTAFLLSCALNLSAALAADVPKQSLSLDYKQGSWSTSKRTIIGHITIIKRNESYLPIQHRDYPYILVLTLMFKSSDQTGLPNDKAELERAATTEHAIADNLFQNFGALYLLSATHSGTRDMYVAFNAPVDTSLIKQAIKDAKPELEYRHVFREDPTWRIYYSLLSN